jgi:ubiquitin thioesterase OTU1
MIRVRDPRGSVFSLTLSELEPLSVKDLTAMLKEKAVMGDDIEVLSGYPPAVICSSLPSDESRVVSDLNLTRGDTLILRACASPHPPPATSPSSQPEPTRIKVADLPPPPINRIQSSQVSQPGDEEEDAELALALAASLSESAGAASSQRPAAEAGPPKVAPTAIKMSDGSILVRRIVDSDNSCLFNSVGYLLMNHDKTKSKAIRAIVSKVIRSDPFTYNEGMLEGKNTNEYCKWIESSDKWGGALELSVLSEHFKTEIAAYDIRTKRCDVYSSEKGFKERCYLVYDGLHYDPLAVSLFEQAKEEIDLTVFPSPEHALSPAERDEGSKVSNSAAALVAEIHGARQFTDVANFTLRCGTCLQGLKGEKEAVEHAKSTGHSNFQEY